MVLQNYQNLIEMTSNINDIVAFGVGFKHPRKIHLNTSGGGGCTPYAPVPSALQARMGCMFIELCMVYVPLIHMYSVSCAGWRGGEQVV